MGRCKWIMKMSLITCFIAIMAMGCQNEAIIEEPASYYFSEDLGFQENDGQIWQEMVEDSIVIKNDDKTMTIQNVFWKDGEVIFEAQLENCLRVSDFETFELEEDIKLYSEDLERTMSAHSITSRYSEDNEEIDYISMKFRCKNACEEFVFDVFGEKYRIEMQPIKEYASLEEVGYTQTHNGRSIVVRDDGTERKAYTYSNDLWKIVGFEDIKTLWLYFGADEETRKNTPVPKIQWGSWDSIDNKVFTCNDDTIKKADSFDFPAVRLKAECEELQIPITLPEEKQKVNIPFSIGEDKYRISEIEVKPGYYDPDKFQECTDIYIRIESVKVEKGTQLYSVQAVLGVEEEVKGQSFDSTTGKTEIKVYGTRFNEIGSTWGIWDNYFFTEDYDKMEPVICIKIDKNTEIPKDVVLKIEEAYKSWDQSYHFELN